MTYKAIEITDSTTILSAGLLAALNEKGNLRGVRDAKGALLLYVSPPKPGSTGIANFFAKLGIGPLHERRVLAALAIEKLVRQTAAKKEGDPAMTSAALLEGIPVHADGALDITTQQLEKAWGLPKELGALSAFLHHRDSGRAVEKFNDLAQDAKRAKGAVNDVARKAFRHLLQQESLKEAKQDVAKSHWARKDLKKDIQQAEASGDHTSLGALKVKAMDAKEKLRIAQAGKGMLQELVGEAAQGLEKSKLRKAYAEKKMNEHADWIIEVHQKIERQAEPSAQAEIPDPERVRAILRSQFR